MAYTYTYLLLNVLLFVVWLVLFWIRKDTRKELLFMSIFFGFIGPLVELVYIHD
ncbi:MAG: hypothetical protein ABIJ21_02750 [Nanoarchaeota archaeon]